MATETIIVSVESEAARIFKTASAEEKRRLEALLSRQLLEAAQERVKSERVKAEPPVDPIFQLGTDPVDIDVTDASLNHDRYLY